MWVSDTELYSKVMIRYHVSVMCTSQSQSSSIECQFAYVIFVHLIRKLGSDRFVNNHIPYDYQPHLLVIEMRSCPTSEDVLHELFVYTLLRLFSHTKRTSTWKQKMVVFIPIFPDHPSTSYRTCRKQSQPIYVSHPSHWYSYRTHIIYMTISCWVCFCCSVMWAFCRRRSLSAIACWLRMAGAASKTEKRWICNYNLDGIRACVVCRVLWSEIRGAHVYDCSDVTVREI